MIATSGTLLGGRVAYAQPAGGFRSGIEPVLLAAAVPAQPGARVLEAGTGAGAALLCLAARVPGIVGTGVERDAALAALATANATANGFGTLRIVAGEIGSHVPDHPADHAFANPPYHPPGGTASPDTARETSKRAAPGLIAAWAEALARCVAPRGSVTLILPAGAVPEALASLAAARCGGARLLPFWPKPGRAAKLVLLQARKDSHAAFAVLPGLVLHRDDGRFTAEAEAILRDGGALPLG